MCPQGKDDKRQNPFDIHSHKGGELHAFARIGFRKKILFPPAGCGGTEKKDHKRTQRQKIITYNKVFQIKYIRSFAKRLEFFPEIEAEYTGQGGKGKDNGKDDGGFYP